MSLLRRRRATTTIEGPAADLVHDRIWADPDLDAAADAVERERGTDPDAAIDAALAHLVTVRSDAERLQCASEALGERLTGQLDALRRRAHAAGGGAREDVADVLTLLGLALHKAAWEARGHGEAATVGADAQEIWSTFNAEADDVLAQAVAVSPDHPGATVGRLQVAFAVHPAPEEWWERFDVARRARATQFRTILTMTSALSGRWFGSKHQALDFAREAAAAAPAGDPVTAVLALGHCEYLMSVSMTEDGSVKKKNQDVGSIRNADQAALEEASHRWLGRSPVPPHPYAVEAHHWFAWVFRPGQGAGGARQQELAQHHFRSAGNRVPEFPWGIWGNTAEEFLTVRSRAGVTG